MFQRRSLIHLSLAVIALIIIFYPYLSRKPDPIKVEEASVAALAFLDLIDAGDYERSRRLCSAHLCDEYPLDAWLEHLSTNRGQVGEMRQRRQSDFSYTRDPIEGIPAGEYMSFFYTADFEHKSNVKERVTLYLEGESVWRVAGYFIE